MGQTKQIFNFSSFISALLNYTYRFSDSGMDDVGRDFQRPDRPVPLLNPGSAAAGCSWYCDQLGFASPQEWRLHKFSGHLLFLTQLQDTIGLPCFRFFSAKLLSHQLVPIVHGCVGLFLFLVQDLVLFGTAKGSFLCISATHQGCYEWQHSTSTTPSFAQGAICPVVQIKNTEVKLYWSQYRTLGALLVPSAGLRHSPLKPAVQPAFSPLHCLFIQHVLFKFVYEDFTGDSVRSLMVVFSIRETVADSCCDVSCVFLSDPCLQSLI